MVEREQSVKYLLAKIIDHINGLLLKLCEMT